MNFYSFYLYKIIQERREEMDPGGKNAFGVGAPMFTADMTGSDRTQKEGVEKVTEIDNEPSQPKAVSLSPVERMDAGGSYARSQTEVEKSFDQNKFRYVKSLAETYIAELQDSLLHQKVEAKLTRMLEEMPVERANALLDMAIQHPPEAIEMLRGFVYNVMRSG